MAYLYQLPQPCFLAPMRHTCGFISRGGTVEAWILITRGATVAMLVVDVTVDGAAVVDVAAFVWFRSVLLT